MADPLLLVRAGTVPYEVALSWQEELVARRQAGAGSDVVLLLSHPPTYTAGRNADLAANLTGARPDIPVVRIDRGGDLTYHGPGQVVAYPILRLAQRGAAKAHVGAMEEAIIRTLARFGIPADRRPGYPGVWVPPRGTGTPPDKIAAIGVRLTGGVSKHGLALNVDPDMDDFTGIIPCGIRDGGVTSMALEGAAVEVAAVEEVVGPALAEAFGRAHRWASLAALELPEEAGAAARG